MQSSVGPAFEPRKALFLGVFGPVWAHFHAYNSFLSLPATYHYVRVVLVLKYAVLRQSAFVCSNSYLFVDPRLVQIPYDVPEPTFELYALFSLEMLFGQVRLGHDCLHELDVSCAICVRHTLSSVTPTLHGCLVSTCSSNSSL